jgi:hypothetical protein
VVPISPISPPATIAEVFGDDKIIMKAVRAMELPDESSVAPIMMLPPTALLKVPNIGPAAAKRITMLLKKHKLGHRQVFQKSIEFINCEFGCIEDAPIGVFQVFVKRNGDLNWPEFGRLQLLTVLETIEPNMRAMDISGISRRDVIDMVTPVVTKSGIVIDDLEEDLAHLTSRLGYFNLEFVPEEFMEQPYRRLRLVR